MDQDFSEKKMIQDITRLGVQAAVLLRGVMLQKVDRETLEWGLQELSVSEIMNNYFQKLISQPQYVYLLNILHLLFSLEGQLDYQIREYGMDSLKDDLQEINFSLQQIGSQFDLEALREPI